MPLLYLTEAIVERVDGLFASAYAPSTLDSFLRLFTWGHSLQLDPPTRICRPPSPCEGGCCPRAESLVYVDVDSLLRRFYGSGKQARHSGMPSLAGTTSGCAVGPPLAAAVSTERAAPVVGGTAVRLRGGNAGSARAAASLVVQAIAMARTAGASGPILVLGDNAFGSGPVVSACHNALG